MMNDTQTPREEFEEWLETVKYDNSDILSPSSLAWEAWQAAQNELTEQRDELADLKKHIDVQNKLINTLQSKKVKFKKQRDSLHELHNKNAARSKELLELCGTLRKELTAVNEQRDRLAEALQSIKCELGVPQPEYPSPVANAYEIADEALQSLDKQTEP